MTFCSRVSNGNAAQVELLCEDALYLGAPDPYGVVQVPLIAGLVVRPLEEERAVRLEFSEIRAELHLRCRRVVVRRDPL